MKESGITVRLGALLRGPFAEIKPMQALDELRGLRLKLNRVGGDLDLVTMPDGDLGIHFSGIGRFDVVEAGNEAHLKRIVLG